MKRLFVVACIASLAACGADSDKREVENRYQQEWEQLKASLIYTYPAKQQVEVPTHSPVVLHFSRDIIEDLASIKADLVVTADGNPVPFTVDFANNRTLMIEVDGGLAPRTAYEVSIPEVDLAIGTTKASALGFQTKGLTEGPRSAVAGDAFEIVRMIPDGKNYPVVDFAAFRVQFSDVLDAGSVVYGDSVSLKGDGGALVDAHVLVKGHYLTVDPKSDLTPGASYTLSITDGVRSKSGVQIPAQDYVVDVRGTGPRERLVHEVPDIGVSPLTGRPINMIPMASVLLGEDTETQSSGNLLVELAYAANFPDEMPIRVPRGTLLEAAELVPVLIGGGVDAGFNSGDVRITFISDATGYMIPNPHSNSDDAPRNIHLFMDVGVSTADPTANGAINQNILHIELVGTAIVENGGLTVNAVGMVEPEVLGSERAKALLSFYMEGKPGEPEPAADTVPPQLVSWTPGENPDDSFGVNDSILFVFNEPVSIDGASIELRENGTPIDAEVSVDGTTLIIKPRTALKRSAQRSGQDHLTALNAALPERFSPFDFPAAPAAMEEVEHFIYTVHFDATGSVADISGNSPSGVAGIYQFELPPTVTLEHDLKVDFMTFQFHNEIKPVTKRSPIVLGLYPGYPCVYDEAYQDLDRGILGRCRDGLRETYEPPQAYRKHNDDFLPVVGASDPHGRYQINRREADDLIHLPELAADKPIIVLLSKEIDARSVVLGVTFTVERLGEVVSPVAGDVMVEGNVITFWPSEPWEVGARYRYTLSSNGDSYDPDAGRIRATTAVCDGTDAVCDVDGLPVQTQLKLSELVTVLNAGSGVLLEEYPVDAAAGGPDMVQYFMGVEKNDGVLQVLRAPSLDRNANLWAEINLEDRLGNSVGGADGNPAVDVTRKNYAVEERSSQPFAPITGACTAAGDECLDPAGVSPLPNTVKLLSRAFTTRHQTFDYELEEGGLESDFGLISGLNTGCAYESDWLTPYVCPENKFIYLSSGLVAEVQGYDELEGAVSVRIWPGQLLATSLPVSAVAYPANVFVLDSGPLRIRMRYAKDEPECVDVPEASCSRTRPIQAWLRNYGEGPVLEAEVDAYIDALELEDNMDMRPFINNVWRHELVSVPVSLRLSGPVEFLEDGRMVVNQFNADAVQVRANLWSDWKLQGYPDIWSIGGVMDFIIPAQGAHIKFISTPIK